MSSKFALAASVTVGVAGVGYVLWSMLRRSQRPALPTSWVQVGTLDDLLAYPIKSCQWVQLEEAECTSMGLRVGWLRDRTLMVIDKKNNFISARSYPEMLRVKVTFDGPLMAMTHPNMEPVVVDLREASKTSRFRATVWSTPVQVHSCGWEPSEWFSRLLLNEADSLRLVMYAGKGCRPLRPSASPIYRFLNQDTGAFPDETSYNLINKSSIEDLNQRIDSGETTCWPRQFRPNFVVKGATALEEDDWQFVRIGDNVFEVIKACFRCVMTTIDPMTALKNPKGDPLETLKSYRQSSDQAVRKSAGSSPRMGLQLALRSAPGTHISIHDPVYIPAPVPNV